jgi:acyl-CoA dehydrogenase
MSTLDVPKPDFMQDEELAIFENSVIKFFEEHAPPERVDQWREDGQVERAFWTEAGQAGILGVSIPEEYGGGGGDFRHDTILLEQVARMDVAGFGLSLHNCIVTPYVLAHGTEEQKQRWLPRLCNGELVAAVAMSEPGAGSDLQAIRTTALKDGNGYRINGAKTFISSGQNADFIVVVAKTDPSQGARGVSLVVVETEQAEGFRRGRKLDKIGLDAADTSELFFDDVFVPADNLLGMEEGRGFKQLMQELPRERLTIALGSAIRAELAVATTIDYTTNRKVFGQRVIDFQNSQFKLAEMKTQATIARVFVNHCLGLLLKGQLDTTTVSMAKYWITEVENKIIDEGLQLHGGYGYMNEYPIARMYRDARISRIFGGSNEIMKVLIARTLES